MKAGKSYLLLLAVTIVTVSLYARTTRNSTRGTSSSARSATAQPSNGGPGRYTACPLSTGNNVDYILLSTRAPSSSSDNPCQDSSFLRDYESPWTTNSPQNWDALYMMDAAPSGSAKINIDVAVNGCALRDDGSTEDTAEFTRGTSSNPTSYEGHLAAIVNVNRDKAPFFRNVYVKNGVKKPGTKYNQWRYLSNGSGSSQTSMTPCAITDTLGNQFWFCRLCGIPINNY